ncbi:MAG: hypothetical protein ACTHJ1_01195 [Bordetella sp.]|uniref:hypothetical protein n=1 Tax=Bordetella sp. TaxID=28081 RepID=UPI003F7C62FF
MTTNTCALLGKREPNRAAAPTTAQDAVVGDMPPAPAQETCTLTSRTDAARAPSPKQVRAVRKLLDTAARHFDL